MKLPPLLLLLLLMVGFVNCIPQEKREGRGAEDTLVPQSSVGSSGGLSRNLSEDVDQQSVKQLPREVRADDDTQVGNYLKEPSLFEQGEENISLPKALSRSLRIFRNRKTPSRSKKRSRGRYGRRGRSRQKPKSYGASYNNFQQGRYGRRGSWRQKPKSYGASYNNFQQDDNDYSSSKKKDIEKNDGNYGEDNDEDGSDGDFDDDDNEEDVGDEEEEEKEVYQPLRRPPESRRGNPRRGYDEEHEDMKRGYREHSNLDSDDESRVKSREKRQVGSYIRGRDGSENDSDRDSSDSEEANETTPLLRSSRKKAGDVNVKKRLKANSRKTTDTTKTNPVPKRNSYPNIRYQQLNQRDRERKDVVKRGLGSSKLKKRVRGNSRQNLGGNGNGSLDVIKNEVLSELKDKFEKDKAKSNLYARFRDRESKDLTKRGPSKIFKGLFKKTGKSSSRKSSSDSGNKSQNVMPKEVISELSDTLKARFRDRESKDLTKRGPPKIFKGLFKKTGKSSSGKRSSDSGNKSQNVMPKEVISELNNTLKARFRDRESKNLTKRGPPKIFKGLFKKTGKSSSGKSSSDSENKSQNVMPKEVISELNDTLKARFRDPKNNDLTKRGLPKKFKGLFKKTGKSSSGKNSSDSGKKSLDVMQKEVISELDDMFKKKKTANPSITYQGRRGSGRNDRRYNNDGYYEGGEDPRINLRGFFSNFLSKFKKKTATSSLNQKPSRFKGWFTRTTPRPNSYQRLRDSEEYGDDDDDYYEDNEGQDIYKRFFRDICNWRMNKVTSTSSPSPLFGNTMSEELQKNKTEIGVNGGSEDKNEDGRVSRYDEGDSEDQGIGSDYNEDEDDDDKEEEEEEEEGKDQNDVDYNEGEGENRKYDDDDSDENEEKGQEYDDYENEAQNEEN